MPLSTQLKGGRVLILEDEPVISAILESAVLRAGYTIIGPAMDVSEALHLIRSEQIDAAILDLIVQGTYCDDVADELIDRSIPFAMTTGLGIIRGHPRLGAVPRITKPFTAEYVQGVLAGLLTSQFNSDSGHRG